MEKRNRREVVSLDKGGHVRMYPSGLECARELGVSTASIYQAMDRSGVVKGYRLFYTPSELRKQATKFMAMADKLEEAMS